MSSAYFTISVALWYFVRQRQDLVFRYIFLLFGAFILACGLTHLLNVWNVWVPDYWLSGLVKAITAAVSLATAIVLWPLIPRALSMASPEQLRELAEKFYSEIEKSEPLLHEALILHQPDAPCRGGVNVFDVAFGGFQLFHLRRILPNLAGPEPGRDF